MADIQKFAVYDSRIVQSKPKYAVYKGSASNSTTLFNAISQTASQHTYNVQVPSPNTFIDRSLTWQSTPTLQFSVSVPVGALAGEPVARPGRDFALSPFPLHSTLTSMQATINDCNVSIDTQTVLNEVLRLADYKEMRKQRTCPTQLDRYQSYNSSAGFINSSIAGYNDSPDSTEVHRGAWPLVFTDPNGVPLVAGATPAYAGALYNADANAVPVLINPVVGVPQAVPLYVQFTSFEKLVLSPFVFGETYEYEDCGLYGIDNIQLTFVVGSPARLIRNAVVAPWNRTISAVQFLSALPFQNSSITCNFLTPALDLPLPVKSVVPYMEYPRYPQQVAISALANGATTTLTANAITLPYIPDYIVMYVKPQAYTQQQGDFYLPVDRVSIQFDNVTGLLSSHRPHQLYSYAIKNGLDMDWLQWAGLATSSQIGAVVPTCGGFLVLRPGIDFALSEGLAPGVVGQFVMNYDLTVRNNTGASLSGNFTLTTMLVGSGFMESVSGSSRLVRGGLTMAEVLSAPLAPEAPTRSDLARMVGGQGIFGKVANALSKVKDVYDKAKPIVGALKDRLPEKAKSALSRMGAGQSGGARTGGRMADRLL